VSRRRWWEGGERSVEAEAAWFAEDGLDFRLDDELFDEHEAVVFRGELRLGDRTTPAAVHYPPAYGAGAHPAVFAPKLRLGRHQSPHGELCLDHAVFGETAPMYGGEAALRAQRLWDLRENDPKELARREADAPDPRTNYYEFTRDSAVTLIDVNVSGFEEGDLLLGALQIAPLRAALSRVRTTRPTQTTVRLATSAQPFGGNYAMTGVWRRVDSPPPVTLAEFVAWAKNNYGQLIDEQANAAKLVAQAHRQRQKPVVVAFVFPDEGPRRGETHDAWAFLAIAPDGQVQLVRGFHLRSQERWLRQPQLQPLEHKRAGVVGVGALGSPIADQLAKAGLGGIVLVDHDISTPGNRVRHQLDLTDVGRAKVIAMADRVLRVNPWCDVRIQGARFGSALSAETRAQSLDDEIADELGDCQLIVNATAHTVTGSYCSQVAHEVGKPVVHVWVSAGAWGGRILLQRPGHSGCSECLALAQKRPEAQPDGLEVPLVSDDPDVQEVMEQGCADSTFTGPGFELSAAASAATRVAVQLLLAQDGGYPAADFDLVTLNFRDATSAMPTATYTRLPVHPECTICNAASGA